MPIVSAESMVPNAPEDPFALINKVQVMRSNQALAEERQRKVQTEAEIQAIAQRHGDDHDATVAEISRKYPALGYKIGQDLEQQRYNKAQALLENSKLEREKIQNGLSLLQGVAPDGSNWEPVRDGVIKDNPKLTPFLAGKPYSPELVQTIAKAGQTQDAYLDQIQKASEGYLNKEKQLAYAHLVVANDINPAKQQATQQMIKGAGLSLFGQAIPDVASAQTIIDQYAKAESAKEASWQLKESMVGGKRTWMWANPKTQEAKPAEGMGAPIPPASLIIQNQNAGAVSNDLPNQVRTTLSGKRYIDLGDFQTPKERSAAQAAAVKQGIMAVDKQTGASLRAIDTAKQNSMSIWNQVKDKLPKDAQGRLTVGPRNKLAAYFQTDQDLAAFNSWRVSAIQSVQALAEPGMGLRITKSEIDAAQQNDIPQITDDIGTAAQRIKNFITMLNHKENDALTRNRSSLSPNAAPKANPFLKK